MSIIRQIQRMKFIDLLVRKRATGNLETFAQKNRLSKRGLTDILQEMKDIGFPIKYSRRLNSYYYEEDGEMVKCLFLKKGDIISPEQAKYLKGGDVDNLCFSRTRVFEICENED